jgi:hypothetical protein
MLRFGLGFAAQKLRNLLPQRELQPETGSQHLE